ncbi:MAG: hypothetical protein UH824_03105, partial [Acutalibacteraceae bacterium]|nr:hypothetical protein [Acutalibacteraceae bacterium]
ARFKIGHTPRKFPTIKGSHLPHQRMTHGRIAQFATLVPKYNNTTKSQLQVFFSLFDDFFEKSLLFSLKIRI